MADRALLNGKIVFATQDNLRKDFSYYCATPGCNVHMSLIANGERQRHFRSERQADHISIECTRHELPPLTSSEVVSDISAFAGMNM